MSASTAKRVISSIKPSQNHEPGLPQASELDKGFMEL